MDFQDIRNDYYLRIKDDKYLLDHYQFRREGSEQLLVLNRYQNCYELLNLPAAIVYLMCNGDNSIEALCITIIKTFRNTTESVVINDLVALFNIVRNRGLCSNLASKNGFKLEPAIKMKSQNVLDHFLFIASEQNYKPPSILVIDC